MKLQQFTNQITKSLKEYYGVQARVDVRQVYKNNGIALQGLSVLFPGRNASPTVYLDEFYQLYQEGENYGELVHRLIVLLAGYQPSRNLEMDFFGDYSQLKKMLALRLIHEERNRELLREAPHYLFHDLAVSCHCLVENEIMGTGSILIQRSHLKLWGIDEEELFRDAAANSPRLRPYRLHRMEDVLTEMLRPSVEERVKEIAEEYPTDEERLIRRTLQSIEEGIRINPISMYVLTNTARYYGAACLIYDGMIEELIRVLGGDFYILPSSVHEVILVPGREGRGEGYSNMVREINLSQVDREEWLSDHAYFCLSREKKIINSAGKANF